MEKARAVIAEVNTQAGYPEMKEAILRRFNITLQASRIMRSQAWHTVGYRRFISAPGDTSWIVLSGEEIPDKEAEKKSKDDVIVDQ